VEEPASEVSVAGEPTTEEPAIEEPPIEEPPIEEPPIEEPIIEESVASEPNIEASSPVEHGGEASLGVTTEGPSGSIGLSFGVEVSSAYCFRGLNVFQGNSQADQHFVFAPSIAYAIGETGLSLSYWGAYQMNGGNQSELVAAGVGHEQNLVAAYELGLFDDQLALGASLTWYFYPFAREADAGATLPSYLEPGITVGYNGPVEVSVALAYFAGIQTALQDLSYFYVRPHIGRTFSLNSHLDLSLGLAFGYKVFRESADVTDNVYDLQFDWEMPVDVGRGFSLKPGVHVAWTNFSKGTVGSEYMIWAGVSADVAL
jgi:hypothetical protein